MLRKPKFKIVQLTIAIIFLLNSAVYGIDLPAKSYLRVPSIASFQGRLNEGMTAMLNRKGLSAEQHELLNRAFGEFFEVRNNL